MNPKISSVLIAVLLAPFGLFPPDLQPNPVEAARLNNLGCAYMNQQLFEKGLKSFQQAAEADPSLLIARLNQAVAYLNLQKTEEAKALLEGVVKQDPKNPNAWYSVGLLAKNTGDAQAAIEAFKHVSEIDPNDADTWYFLGTAYVQAKEFSPAIDAFEHALKINPLHASAEFGLSRAYQQSADVDHAREHLKRFQYITQNKIGAPMSLAYGEQGQYSRAVESPAWVMKPPPQIKVQFVDVTKEAGIETLPTDIPMARSPYFLGPGACFLDYDNDGRIDLLLPGNGARGVTLYHNLGSGKFEDVTRKAGLDPSQRALSCTAGDYDNDGFADFVLGFPDHVALFHNEKNGTFKNVTVPAGIPGDAPALGLNFVDYDHDGDIDLLVLAPGGNLLLRNNGDGTFTEISKEKGFDIAETMNALGSDVNNDRAVDVVTSRRGGRPQILFNRREGKFELITMDDSAPLPTLGLAVLDFDHDGWMDIAFTQFVEPGLTLWRNVRGRSFVQVKLPATGWSRAYGVAAFDYDNDGWIDLVAVGETKEGKGEVRLFRNLGPDGFKDVTADVGLDKIHLESPRAIITGDYDNDGATDLLITQNHGPAVLLRNVGGNQNHWLRLALKGLNDNKSAIGTKVEVFAGGNRQKFEIAG